MESITSDVTELLLLNNPLGSIPDDTFSTLGLTALDSVNLESTGLSDNTVTVDSFLGLESVRYVSIQRSSKNVYYAGRWP